MYNSGLIFCCLAGTLANLLLFSGTGVESTISPFRYRILSRSSGRFVIMKQTGEVNANGDDEVAADVFLDLVSSNGEEDQLRILNGENQRLVLGINSETGQLQASTGSNPSFVDTFRFVQTQGIENQFLANVSLPCSLLGNKGSASLPTVSIPEACKVVVECGVAFYGDTQQPISCQDQEELSEESRDSARSFTFRVQI